MKKKYIFWLTGVMSLSLIGIIAVQLMWINNAIEVREKQFSSNVNHAMRRIVNRLEARRSMFWMSQQKFSSMPRQQQSPRTRVTPAPRDTARKGRINFDFRVNINGFKMNINSDDLDSTAIVEEQNPENPRVRRFRFDTLIEAPAAGKELTDSMRRLMQERNAAQKSLYERQYRQFQQMMQQMQYEMQFLHSPVRNRLQLDGLRQVIERELANQGIGQDFEYAIMHRDSILPYRSEGFNPKKSEEAHNLNLFPNDIFNKDFRLYLHFPEEKEQIYSSLGLLLTGSGFFTLVILGVFTVTLWIILRQKKISEIKTDFINNMTHEFKTPIATISVAADTLTNPKITGKPGKIAYFASMIKQENKRMNMQVENILQMALLEKKDFHLNFQEQDIHALVKKAIDSVSLQVEKRQGRIDAQLEAAQHHAEVDEVHFTNVLYNLLENANKYSREEPQISVTTTDGSQGMYISVSDQGIGMSQDLKSRIFDRFYRAPTGNVHNVKGFGIGLSYVKAIVNAHGGTIRVKSKPEKGSTFDIFLPYKHN